MKFYKFIQNGKTAGVSNMETICDNCETVEITEQEYNEYTANRQKLFDEMLELNNWFDGYYAVHEQKYRRLIALNKLDDDGANATDKLTALYEEAEIKRRRIQELETLN